MIDSPPAGHSPQTRQTQPAAQGAAPAPVLVARDLWLSYDGRGYALRGVNLDVQRGSVTMVVGRSGSGKTSLLKALNGLVKPQRGTVQLELAHQNGRSPRHHIAYVPQTLGLVRSMTALENTLTGALSYTRTLPSLAKLFPKPTADDAKELLASLGLGDKLRQKVHALSGGERQRVAIARALMQRPDVILADEFVSQLDPLTTEEILAQTRAIAARGVALLVTTHETEAVTSHADRLVVMRAGEVAFDGDAGGVPVAAILSMMR
jgi:phosphonate transport system ATP-binding protein